MCRWPDPALWEKTAEWRASGPKAAVCKWCSAVLCLRFACLLMCPQSLETENIEIVVLFKKTSLWGGFLSVHILTLFHSSLDPGNCWLCEECHGKNDITFILFLVCFKFPFMENTWGIAASIITSPSGSEPTQSFSQCRCQRLHQQKLFPRKKM